MRMSTSCSSVNSIFFCSCSWKASFSSTSTSFVEVQILRMVVYIYNVLLIESSTDYPLTHGVLLDQAFASIRVKHDHHASLVVIL